jgi:hypothetical protein
VTIEQWALIGYCLLTLIRSFWADDGDRTLLFWRNEKLFKLGSKSAFCAHETQHLLNKLSNSKNGKKWSQNTKIQEKLLLEFLEFLENDFSRNSKEKNYFEFLEKFSKRTQSRAHCSIVTVGKTLPLPINRVLLGLTLLISKLTIGEQQLADELKTT